MTTYSNTNLPPGVSISDIPGIDDREVDYTIEITITGECDVTNNSIIIADLIEYLSPIHFDSIHVTHINHDDSTDKSLYTATIEVQGSVITAGPTPDGDDSDVISDILDDLTNQTAIINWSDFKHTIEYEMS